MTCDEIDDLLAAYALDAVDDDERAAIEDHLATCEHPERHEVDSLRAAAIGLATLAEEREPSVALEARLLASVERGSETRPRPGVGYIAGRPRRDLRWAGALVAGVVLMVAGFVAGALLFSGDDGSGEALVQVVQKDAMRMRAEAVAGESPVTVTLAGLGRLPEDAGYQVWAVRDDGWVTVGICNTDEDGWWEGDFDFALRPDDALAITIEPREGSPTPTGEVVLRSTGWERTAQ